MSGEAPYQRPRLRDRLRVGRRWFHVHWRVPIAPRFFKVHRFPSWDDGGGAVQVGPVTLSWTTLPKRGDQ